MMELYKIIERKEKLPVGYRMIQCDSASVPQTTSFTWRLAVKSSPEVPRFIIVGFQTNKHGNQRQNPSDYKTLYPLFLFDVSKQSERLKYSVTDIQIKVHFDNNMNADTEAYAIIISDRLINFQSDGKKMSVVY